MNGLKQNIVALLRWSERYTKTDMVYLVGNGFWLTLGQGISSLTSLALVLVFANVLPKETYGTYKFVLSIAGILAIFTLPGINGALINSVARGHLRSLFLATKARILWSLVGTMIGVLLVSYYAVNGNQTLALSMLFVAIFLPIFDTFTTYSSYLQGQKRFREDAIYSSIAQIGGTTVLGVSIFFIKQVALLIAIYFLAYSIFRIAAFLMVAQHVPVNTTNDSATVRYGKHLSFMDGFTFVASNIDKLLLFHLLGPVQVAIYSIATIPLEHIKGFSRRIAMLALPKFAQKPIYEINGSLREMWWKTALLATVLLVISLVYILAAPFLFETFFPAYTEAVLLSQIFAPSLIVGAFFLPLNLLQGQGKTRELYIFRTASAITQTILYLTLIPLFGLVGAITAWVATRVFNMIVVSVLTLKAFRPSTSP